MKPYNRRTWLNPNTSDSTGSIVAYDGKVKYTDGVERTTFLEISDCRNKVRIIKNTESRSDFIEKIKLLKSEIELFIKHLEKIK